MPLTSPWMSLVKVEKTVAYTRLPWETFSSNSVIFVLPLFNSSKKRIPSWGLRPGLPVGCMLTLRKENAIKVLKRLLTAKDNNLAESNFDEFGNVSFGIHEYIDIPGVAYDPKIGILGLQVCVSLEKPGFRIKRRRNKRKKIPKNHFISKEEAIDFMKKNFGIKVGEAA